MRLIDVIHFILDSHGILQEYMNASPSANDQDEEQLLWTVEIRPRGELLGFNLCVVLGVWETGMWA
jgi:hypothetical protein